MGCVFPNAHNLREFWRLMRRGEDGITEVPESHWRVNDYFDADPKRPDMTYCARGGFLPRTAFDPTEWGIPPTAIEATDTAQLLSLVAAKAAIEDAGYQADPREESGDVGTWERGDAKRGTAEKNGRRPVPLRPLDRDRASVICGVTGTLELALPLAARLGHPKWRKALLDAGVDAETVEDVIVRIADSYVGWQESSFPGLLGNVVAGRIANRLDLRGTNCVVDAACASSLSALHLGVMELQSRRADVVVSGGSDTLNDIFMFMCFSKTPALSPSGDARPFSEEADGTVIGEGVGMVVLKRLDDARRDGDRIYAVVRSVGAASDGRSQSIYAPRAVGQARALRRAYEEAGVSPTTVELVEAHGTGTKVGDVVEFDALRQVYREAGDEGRWCALGSVKSQIGHTKAAAGVAGLIKAALALHHKVLPPTLKVERPNPKLELEASPFYLNTLSRPWFQKPDHPRRAAVSSFGFGGSNFHVVLEECYGADSPVAWDGSVQIAALSADTRDGLLRQVEQWRHAAPSETPAELAVRCHASRAAFSALQPYRLVLVLETDEDAAALLDESIVIVKTDGAHGRSDPSQPSQPSQPSRDRKGAVESRGAGSPQPLPHGRGSDGTLSGNRGAVPANARIFFSGATNAGPAGKLALLFPGQGSQQVNMARGLACVFPDIRRAITRAAAADELLNLPDRIYPQPVFGKDEAARQERALVRTDVAQPAIGAVSLGMLRILERFGVKPDFAAGHSYGELVALHASGAIDESALFELSRLRGRLMADLKGERGGMLAVMAPLTEIERLIEEQRLDIVLANRNNPAQAVLSGSLTAIDEADEACRRAGFRTRRLDVAAAFHSPLVADAARPFRDALEAVEFKPPAIPAYSNTTAKPYPADAAAARDLLGDQLARPVDFVNLVRNLYDAGARVFVEVGPGAVLTGLARSILGERPHLAASLDAPAARDQDRSGPLELACLLSRLAAAGYAIELARWEPDAPAVRKPGMVVPLVGANYRSPRPERPPRKKAAVATTAASPVRSSTAIEPHEPATGGRLATRGAEPARDDWHDVSDQHLTRNIGAGAAATPRLTPESRMQRMMEPQPSTPSRPAVSSEPVYEPSVPADAERPAAQPAASEEAYRVVSEGVRAMQSLQQQTADLHMRFLEGQELAQRNLLRLIEGTALQAQPSGAPSSHHTVPPRQPAYREARPAAPSTTRQESRFEPASREPLARTAPAGDALDWDEAWSEPQPSTTAPVRAQTPPQPAAANTAPSPAAPAAAAAMSPAPAAQPIAIADTLLAIVAELTGYPTEMVKLDMDMEADLGIDSIKRVEILATLEQRVPEFTGVNPEYMGTLRTLRQILDYVKTDGAAEARSVAAPPPSKSCAAGAATCSPSARESTDAQPTKSAEPAAPLIGHGYFGSAYDIDAWEEPSSGGGAPSAVAAPPRSMPSVPSSAVSSDVRVMFEREIDIDRHPFLRSHVIGGRAVLPVAMMIEWLGQAALHENPGLRLCGFDDLRVLKGVVLNGRPRIAVLAGSASSPNGTFRAAVEMRDADTGQPHARAAAVLAPQLPAAPRTADPAPATYAATTLSVAEIYENILFHGEHLQAIEQIDGCDERGMAVRLRAAPTPCEWMSEPLRSDWLADPLVLDGCLQLGLVWSARHLGALSLPSCIGRYRQYSGRFPADGATAELRVIEATQRRLTGDIHVRYDAGGAVALLEGCEWTVDASLAEQFRRRTLAQDV
jgi:acyl transferase domain-containing protein